MFPSFCKKVHCRNVEQHCIMLLCARKLSVHLDFKNLCYLIKVAYHSVIFINDSFRTLLFFVKYWKIPHWLFQTATGFILYWHNIMYYIKLFPKSITSTLKDKFDWEYMLNLTLNVLKNLNEIHHYMSHEQRPTSNHF